VLVCLGVCVVCCWVFVCVCDLCGVCVYVCVVLCVWCVCVCVCLCGYIMWINVVVFVGCVLCVCVCVCADVCFFGVCMCLCVCLFFVWGLCFLCVCVCCVFVCVCARALLHTRRTATIIPSQPTAATSFLLDIQQICFRFCGVKSERNYE